MQPLKKVTRLEIVDENGRTVLFNQHCGKEVALSVQDDGRTLKLFIGAKGTVGVKSEPSDIPSMSVDSIFQDIEPSNVEVAVLIEKRGDRTQFRVDPTVTRGRLEGVAGTEELSENEA